MISADHIIIILDKVSKLLDDKIRNTPEAKTLVDDLIQKLERAAAREKETYKISSIETQFAPDSPEEILRLKTNEIIAFLIDHVVKR